MCKPGYHFKLCTCSSDEIDEENFWRLLRIDTSEGAQNMSPGTIAFPLPQSGNTTIIYLKKKMLEDLNQHKVFDFEYAPVDGDQLIITLDGQEISFQYEGGKFVEDEEYYDFIEQTEVAEGRIDVA